jgi:glycerophosphoryl diester phosphodiesterase
MIITKLIAHRGDNKNFPENSYKGIKAALQAGARYIEFDIQMTADQQFIVHHDADLKRTAKKDVSVFAHNYDDLRKFSIHESTRFNNAHYPTPISLLADILQLLKEYPDATAFVEIKTQSLKKWGKEAVMNALLPLLAPYQAQCVLISFNSLALHYAKQHSTLKTGWVIKKYNAKTHEKAENLHADFLICDYKKLPKNKIPWQGHWEWMLYSINEPETAFYYAQQGICYIETDDIQRLLASPLLQSRKAA